MRLASINISLIDHPKTGYVQMVHRLDIDDRRDIKKAADALGLRISQFSRMVLVQASRKVLSEAEYLKAKGGNDGLAHPR